MPNAGQWQIQTLKARVCHETFLGRRERSGISFQEQLLNFATAGVQIEEKVNAVKTRRRSKTYNLRRSGYLY
jgi:hypothetical protein